MSTARKFGTIAIGIIVVSLVLNQFIAAGPGGDLLVNETATVETNGGSGQIGSQHLNVLAVNTSTTSLEDAVELTGANDSEVSASVDSELRGDWSFCTWARADQPVVDNNETRTIAGLGTSVLYYNGSRDEYVAWYYDEGGREAYDASVDAPTPTNMTLVCADRSGSNLTIHRNTTAGETVDMSGTDAAVDPPTANWDGQLEETRHWNYSLNASQRSDLHSEPVLSVNGEGPTARLAYDVYDRSTSSVPVHFASTSASISNATLVDGFDAVSVSEGTDFELTGENNNTVVPTGSGVVDGDGSVLFLRVTAETGSFLERLGSTLNGAMMLLALGLVIIAAKVVMEEW